MTKLLGHIRYPRLLFVLGNLGSCAVIVSMIVLPASAFFADRDERIADKSKLLARLRGIVAQEASIQAIASDTKAKLQSGEFLNGPNENVISANLQTRIKALAEGVGGRTRAVQPLPVKSADHIRYAGSRIELIGTTQAVQRALYAIEHAKPYLFVAAATVKNVPVVARSGVSEEPTISAQLDVYGAVQLTGLEK